MQAESKPSFNSVLEETNLPRKAPLIVWLFALLSLACSDEPDPRHCGEDGALSTCLSPTQSDAYYVEQAQLYFDSMDREQYRDLDPKYSALVARWEWPPWLKLTAYTQEVIAATDLLLRLQYKSVVLERDCRAFAVQPFARCRVVFYYDDEEHQGRGCPIYEEFTFNDAGEITFIEAWSDLPELLPMDAALDAWAETDSVDRLSTRVPGLGRSDGEIDPGGEVMTKAAQKDAVLADFRTRSFDFYGTWLAEVQAAGDDLWARGCGWEAIPW